MAISVDWATQVIYVPKAYTQFVAIEPLTGLEVRQLDTDAFRLDLGAILASEEGLPFIDAHRTNPPVTVGGVTLARVIEIINGYTVEFEDLQYAVNLVGSNNNIADVTIVNQVSIRSQNSAGLTFSEEINNQSYLNARVYIDTVAGQTGTQFPRGTPTDPVDNWGDANFIADARSLYDFSLHGVLNMATEAADDLMGHGFLGASPIASIMVLDGRDTLGATFELLGLTGVLSGRASFRECAIGGPTGLSGFSGIATDCGFNGDITLDATATENILFKDCVSVIAGTAKPTVDCNNTSANIHFRDYSGGLKVTNFTAGNNMSIDINSGSVEIDSTCTAGTIVVRGVTELIDNSGAGCTIVKTGTVTELVDCSGGCVDTPGSITVDTGTINVTAVDVTVDEGRIIGLVSDVIELDSRVTTVLNIYGEGGGYLI